MESWVKLRELTLKRDNNCCYKCGKPAYQVHHLTYDLFHRSQVPIAKLMSLCSECHVLIHGRGTGPNKPETPGVANMDDGLISQQQASVILGVSRARVNQLIAEGKLTPVPFAGRRVLMAAQVWALREQRGHLQKEVAADE